MIVKTVPSILVLLNPPSSLGIALISRSVLHAVNIESLTVPSNSQIIDSCSHDLLPSIDSYVYAMTDPTLEKCRNVRFAPYNFAYPGQNEHFEKAKLDPSNQYSREKFLPLSK